MAWIKLGGVLKILASVAQAAHDQIPQDNQQKAVVSVALQEVHDVADALAEHAANTAADLKTEIIAAVTPILEALAVQAVEAAISKLAGSQPAQVTPAQTTGGDTQTGSVG